MCRSPQHRRPPRDVFDHALLVLARIVSPIAERSLQPKYTPLKKFLRMSWIARLKRQSNRAGHGDQAAGLIARVPSSSSRVTMTMPMTSARLTRIWVPVSTRCGASRCQPVHRQAHHDHATSAIRMACALAPSPRRDFA